MVEEIKALQTATDNAVIQNGISLQGGDTVFRDSVPFLSFLPSKAGLSHHAIGMKNYGAFYACFWKRAGLMNRNEAEMRMAYPIEAIRSSAVLNEI